MNNLYLSKIEYAEHLWHKANTKIAYLLASSKRPAVKNYLLNWFFENYKVNFDDFDKKDIADYESFNDFFTRPLKKGVRAIEEGIVSGVDGTLSQYGDINNGTLLQAKGISYDLSSLFGDTEKAKDYQNGKFMTIYLAPTDYHRVHMPLAGKLLSMTYIPGRLFSVQPSVINNTQAVFSRNERAVCHFEGEYGKFSVVLVGAQLVSGLETVWHRKIARKRKPQTWSYNDISLEKAQELGRFNFGSTIILCFEKGAKFNDKLKMADPIKLGENIASYTEK